MSVNKTGLKDSSWVMVFLSLLLIYVMSSSTVFSAEIPNTQKLKAEMIEQFGIDFLMGQEIIHGDNMELVVDYKGGDVVLPLGSVDFSIKRMRSNPNATRIPLLMTVNVDGVFRRGLWMTAQIKTYAEVVKPVRLIKPGTVLSEDDVVLERSLIGKSVSNVAMRLEDVLGFKTVRGLTAGIPIKLNHLVRAPVVKRGDRLLIVAQRGPMKITTPGIAREKGFKGSMVAVENIESKKIIYGKVINSSMVQVNF
tara:strand:+ start:2979 stop:3734 length:756 start_codon:yes stop_codon:yes gene_type:complete